MATGSRFFGTRAALPSRAYETSRTPQGIELVIAAVRNERQARRMPMLFSPTIGAAIKVVPQFEKSGSFQPVNLGLWVSLGEVVGNKSMSARNIVKVNFTDRADNMRAVAFANESQILSIDRPFI